MGVIPDSDDSAPREIHATVALFRRKGRIDLEVKKIIVLGLIIFTLITLLLTYRMIKHRFRKHNTENLVLICGTFILSQQIEIHGMALNTLKLVSFLMAIIYIGFMIFIRDKEA